MEKITIIFENQYFLCAIKPHGVLSVPSRFEGEDERQVLGRLLEKQLRKTLYPVHRLDFEVGGLILFAKNKEAQTLLSKGFEHKTIAKKYEAITSLPLSPGLDSGKKQTWTCLLAKGKRRAFIADHGKKSITEVVFAGMEAGKNKLWLWPVTGRSHQLRFEMSHHGMPIDGDVLYGSTVKTQEDRVELRSVEIDFQNFPHREKLEAPFFLKNELVE